MNARYHTCDVFTDRQFGGNQLAVFPDAREIAPDLMPRIAREFNYSETTFVLPADDPSHTAKVRIFTPGGELQFAGHPTIGTAHVLATIGAIPLTGNETKIVLEEGVGPVFISATEEDGSFSARLRVERAPEAPETVPPLTGMAAVLSLHPDQIIRVFCAGLGPRFTFAPLRPGPLPNRINSAQSPIAPTSGR